MEKFIDSFIDKYNTITGALVALATAIFGTYWFIFAAYLLFNAIDWITGWRKAKKQGIESSEVGLKGVIKKVGYWVMIAVAFVISSVFALLGEYVLKIDLSFLSMIGWFTLSMLLVNEVRSILENFVELGYDVPHVLINGLAITQKMINKKIDFEEESEE